MLWPYLSNSKKLSHLEYVVIFQSPQCIKEVFPDLLDAECSTHELLKDTKYVGVLLGCRMTAKIKKGAVLWFFHICEFKSVRAEAKF